MIEVDEEVYAKLEKDANDNKSLVKMMRYALIFISFIIILAIYGIKIINISLTNYRTNAECQAAIMLAENNVRVREIESSGMTTEEYLKWLEIKYGEKAG